MRSILIVCLLLVSQNGMASDSVHSLTKKINARILAANKENAGITFSMKNKKMKGDQGPGRDGLVVTLKKIKQTKRS